MGSSKRCLRSSLRSSSTPRLLLTVEALESRTVPYATIGAWPHPELVTLSFMPDGTYLGSSYYSDLFATFNAKWPTAVWQQQILLAAQTWAQYTNLNFAVVPDDGQTFGWGAYQQGDPNIGDIRIGGFYFGSTDMLAGAWFPPPLNNFDVAGDLFFNTVQPFNIGSTYDLYTVATHEFGHALGLLHSSDYYAAMYGAYVGIKSYGLTADDVAGIRSLYSAGAGRSPDGFGFYTNSFQTTADLTGLFNPVWQTLVSNYLDITYAGQAEYFRFLAPSGTSSQLTVAIQSSGLSLFSPYVILYNAYQQPIAWASGYGQAGATVSVTVGGVVPGELFWLRVSGADTSQFGVGRYVLIVNFGPGQTPVMPSPNTATPDGVPLSVVGGWPEQAGTGIVDGHSFDTFDQPAEAVAHPTEAGSVSPPGSEGPRSAPVSVSAAASWIHSLGNPLSHWPFSMTALQPPPSAAPTGTASILPPPLFHPSVRQPFPARTESGSGKEEAPLAAEEWWGEGTSSVPDPPRSPSPAAPSVLAPEWRAACTACFAKQAGTVRPNRGSAAAASSSSTVACANFDSAAALAAMAVVLGGCLRRPDDVLVIRPPRLPDVRWQPNRLDSEAPVSGCV